METPTSEVDIPETSQMRLVCNACLGSKWVGGDEDPHISGWHCGDCGHHRALLIHVDDLDVLKAKREAAR